VFSIKIYQTEKQEEWANRPTKREVLKELHRREALTNNKKLLSEYEALEKGSQGEERLVEYLTRYGNSDWVALRNVWFDNYTEFECDLLLFTQSAIYAFEVKNYTGHLELKNNQCFFNGKLSGHNPVSQAQKMTAGLSQVLSQAARVQGVLSFVGMDNSIQLHDPISGLDVMELNRLRDYIWGMRQEERNHAGPALNVAAALETMSTFEIGRPSKEKEIPEDIKAEHNVRKGVCCSHCASFHLRKEKAYLKCTCGVAEPWEEAIIRTICEYGVIYQEKNLKVRALTEFFDGDASRRTLTRYLNKHFKRIGRNTSTQYVNKRLPFNKVRHEFILPLPSYLRLNQR
jgi:hypothetical protein